jgi:ACDE family multidrug resistance protein
MIIRRSASLESGRTSDDHAVTRLWPLYVGGFLGPFGGAVVAPMLPNLRESFDISLGTAGWAVSAYLLPFAAVMTFSGTLAERIGRRRAVQLAYAGYVLASLACAVAPNMWVFFGGRALQGVANAFTTPVLVAAISNAVPRERLGRSLGLFGSLQAAGQSFAPVVGGSSAAVDWRWAFVVIAITAAALTFVPPGDAPAHDEAPPASLRALANRPLVLACVLAFCAYGSATALTVVGAVYAGDEFGLTSTGRGLAIAVFGLAGLLVGRMLGRLLDVLGLRWVGIASNLALAVGLAVAGRAPGLVVFIGAIALAGAAGTGTRTVTNTLAVTSTPTNRSGATSMALAWQFLGGALAPLLWLPVYRGHGGWAITAAGGWALLAVVLLLAVPRRVLVSDAPHPVDIAD